MGALYCIECEMKGHRVKATRSYISPFSQEKTHLCERHYRDALYVMKAFDKATEPGGPYKGEVGSKGGGASVDMADHWAGKSGALRKKVYEYVRDNGAAGAEDIARAIGEPADNVSPRCSELTTAKYGFLFTKGPRTAITQMGSRAHVYQLTGARNDQVRETHQRRPRASAFSHPPAGHESQGRDDLRRTARP